MGRLEMGTLWKLHHGERADPNKSRTVHGPYWPYMHSNICIKKRTCAMRDQFHKATNDEGSFELKGEMTN